MIKIIVRSLGVLLVGLIILVFALQSSTSWSVGEVARTPETRFESLPDYDFAPNYTEVLGYRMHYVDEGPRDGEVILLLHGQPSWSYLYRHMIPPLAEAGYRVIAPDLVGFGKSDKPLEQSDYSYQMHIDIMEAFVSQLDLEGITLFAQDWGGLIGLRIIPEDSDRYARVMISNTGLPGAGGIGGWVGYPLFRIGVWRKGEVQALDVEGGELDFLDWVAFAKTTDNFDMKTLFQSATYRDLSDEELAGYQAPFADESHMAGARVFPYLVASQLRQNQRAMNRFWAEWDKPFLTAFGDSDPVTAGGDVIWQETVPGAAGQRHVTVENASHFIQDDQPEELVRLLRDFIEQNP
ncbi:MAG: haloalkane dehalogenase [Pseudomonadota bacterium]